MSGLRQHRYADRAEAGRVLAEDCHHLNSDDEDLLVLALPRGGLPVADKVCEALAVPLDVVLVRKLGVPGQPELAMGAVATVGYCDELIMNDPVLKRAGVSADAFDQVRLREIDTMREREQSYRLGHDHPPIKDHTIIIVDDGLATGSTMLAAVQAIGRQDPTKIIIAIPVAPARACAELAHYVDEVICPMPLEKFDAVGLAYDNFDQVPQEEAIELLNRHRRN